ncbi:MAG: polysaccharide biosynthesis protein [Balneolaceae bacterium]|jgi:FlaA1/EpsC-like NDP-sugar epimerase|nr:MAG: polysaccharide biosynthesis protein [Balneolaceae bacterium]
MLKRISDNRDFGKFLLELILWSFCTITAFILRFDGNIYGIGTLIFQTTAILFVLRMFAIYWFGTFRQSWRNTGFRDLVALLKSVSFVSLLFLLAVFFLRPQTIIPFSIPLIDFFLSLFVLSGVRVITRYYLVYQKPKANSSKQDYRVLIAGAGESGNMAAREMFRHPQAGMIPVAFLDDDKTKQGQKFLGLPVAGSIADMQKAVRKYNVDEILIAMPSESGEVIRRVVNYASNTKKKFRIIPSIYDLISGKVSINQIRNVDVEDLLRRKPVQLETTNIRRYIENRVILVTGAGGSIGSEIVRQLARYNPKNVILFGRGENSIHQLVNEIESFIPELRYDIQIGDVRDYQTLERVFREFHPDVVFHAAAHKHVPLMETNPEQAILNNVEGTRNLVDLSIENNVQYFVNISTDKAVNPTSVMGASKRISEQIIQHGAARAGNGEVFVSVRFGNVLGSRGSVVPKFKEQIKNGGPISITHPDMIRYFMTIPEASQLVLQAGALNMNGSIFVLDMGEPVNIEKMARDLITLSGLEPDKDIKIEYTGIRPGEKLFEELLTAEEGTVVTRHKKIYVSRAMDLTGNLPEKLDQIIYTAKNGNRQDIKSAIKLLVPTYHFTEAEAEAEALDFDSSN